MPPPRKASRSAGPFGADTMFHMQGIDAFVVMLHDQGHIAAKLLAPNAAAALTIGTPILFASVAHGSAHDIAGKGIASPQAMIEAVLRLSKAKRHLGLQPASSDGVAKSRAAGSSPRRAGRNVATATHWPFTEMVVNSLITDPYGCANVRGPWTATCQTLRSEPPAAW